MKIVFRIIAWAGLALTIIPSILVLAGQLDFELNKTYMLIGTILWFGGTIAERRVARA